jgi:uncharacterized damage-inducible protein DinB
MIDPSYCLLMARYNRWMNERLYALAGAMPAAERTRDRGAFFGSIHGTLCHLLWADQAWLARFLARPYDVPGYGADMIDDFAELAREREKTDTEILAWAGQLTPERLAAPLRYARKADGRVVQLDGWVGAVHFFNHGTHHRGQVTTLLKQAGIDPGPTDVPWLPGVMRVLDPDAA